MIALLIFLTFISHAQDEMYLSEESWLIENQGIYGSSGNMQSDDLYVYDNTGAVILSKINGRQNLSSISLVQNPLFIKEFKALSDIYEAKGAFGLDVAKKSMTNFVINSNYATKEQPKVACNAIDKIEGLVEYYSQNVTKEERKLSQQKHLASLEIFSLLNFSSDTICLRHGKKLIDRLRELKLKYAENSAQALIFIDTLIDNKIRIDNELHTPTLFFSSSSSELENQEHREGAIIQYSDECKAQNNLYLLEFEIKQFLKTLKKQEKKYNSWSAGELPEIENSGTCIYDFRFHSHVNINSDTNSITTNDSEISLGDR